MGVFDDDDNSDEFEAEFEKKPHRSPGQYIAYHARKQLAFDMWWLVLALWLSQFSFLLLRHVSCLIQRRQFAS